MKQLNGLQCMEHTAALQRGHRIDEACGYVPGVDNQAQVVVAEQMKQRAAKTARCFSGHFCG